MTEAEISGPSSLYTFLRRGTASNVQSACLWIQFFGSKLLGETAHLAECRFERPGIPSAYQSRLEGPSCNHDWPQSTKRKTIWWVRP